MSPYPSTAYLRHRLDLVCAVAMVDDLPDDLERVERRRGGFSAIPGLSPGS